MELVTVVDVDWR